MTVNTNTTPASLHPSLLLVEPDPAAAMACSAVLSAIFEVSHTSSCSQGTSRLTRRRHRFLVTELLLPDGDGVDLCLLAKASDQQISVLVVTNHPERVPDALDAGCDAVLLKPFSPNLLVARLGRLVHKQSALNAYSGRTDFGNRRPTDKGSYLAATHAFWPDIECPRCHHDGVTSFDFSSHRRMWCACLACRHVWLEVRRE